MGLLNVYQYCDRVQKVVFKNAGNQTAETSHLDTSGTIQVNGAVESDEEEGNGTEDAENMTRTGFEQQLREKRELEERLQELEDKKEQMDQLVRHLQALKQASLAMNSVAGVNNNPDESAEEQQQASAVIRRLISQSRASDIQETDNGLCSIVYLKVMTSSAELNSWVSSFCPKIRKIKLIYHWSLATVSFSSVDF